MLRCFSKYFSCKFFFKLMSVELILAAFGNKGLIRYVDVNVYCCSSEFCEKHLQLLFTILEKSGNAVVRANAVIALGDLTFRFPNLIEPWTSHVYARSVFSFL